MSGELFPAEYDDLVDSLDPSTATMSWWDGFPHLSVTPAENVDGPVHSLDEWPTIVRLARASARLGGVDISISAVDPAVVHFGECETGAVTERSKEFVAALAMSGVAARAGACVVG